MVFLGFLIPALSCAGPPKPAPAESPLERPDAEKQGDDFSYPVRTDLVFIPGEFPSLEIPSGAGLVSRDRRNLAASLSEGEKAALTLSFRAAYVDGLLLGLPLAGVLGGDLVHGWPDSKPSGWAQNWRNTGSQADSWGLPSLVLAIQGFERETEHSRVFIVQGKILDQYGKNEGINRANGITGYGSPLGNEFFYDGKTAQRFDFGLIVIDREGKGAFIPEDPPSLGLELPSEIGAFQGLAASPEEVRSAFRTAWKTAVNRNIGAASTGAASIGALSPDGAVQYLSFSGGGNGLRGIYIQSFNRRSVVLALPDSPILPSYPRIIASPFIDVLLAPHKNPLPGGENLKALEFKFSGTDDFCKALMGGFALYGIPLTDPVPVIGDDQGGREAQRFSRGWIMESQGRLQRDM